VLTLNTGKKFEEDFKKSVPIGTYYLRLHDSAIGFDVENSTQRFSLKSPYDIVLCKNGRMYAFELKSNQEKSMSFYGKTSKIKEKQVEELIKAEKSGAFAGLILNFRCFPETYFIKASDFRRFMDVCGKKSININDARSIGILVPHRKLKVNYRYDLSVLLGEGGVKSSEEMQRAVHEI